MNKKLLAGLMALALTLSAGTSTALAANYRGCHGSGCGYSYVDADGDGVCDNYESGICSNSGSAIRLSLKRCLRHLTADGTWVRCADTDEDGVCDTCGKTMSRQFVDENNDGICDNYESGVCNNSGTGVRMGTGRHGHHGGRGR